MILIGIPLTPMSQGDEEAVRKSINQAKFDLVIEKGTTFFATLLSNLRLIIDRSHGTAATNGISLWMNPDFVFGLNDHDELIGLMLHEVLHVAFDHCNFAMYEGYDRRLLNIAQDHHINLYITALGYKIPEGGYCDPQYRGMSSMQIYHMLKKNPPPPDPNFKPDVVGKPKDMSQEEFDEIVNTNIIKAVMQAQMANDHGSIPGEILRKVQKLVSPELPWQLILAKYMDAYAKEDYTWTRPNRRFIPDFYLPCMHSERIHQLTFGMDVSGSMSEDDISEGEAELNYIRSILNPELTRYMTFDTKVHLNKLYEESEELDPGELEGGGGTDVQPLLDSIREEEPTFAIIFTDGYFGEPNMDGISSDIFWMIKGNPGFRAPHGHGEVIHIK